MSRSCDYSWGRFDQVSRRFQEPLRVLERLHLESEGGKTRV